MGKYLLIGAFALVCVGCSGDETVDTPVARKAAAAGIKPAAQLPATMPAEARASAAAAMGQAKAQQDMNNDPARVHAMEMMRKGH
jgi:hypothetical protein